MFKIIDFIFYLFISFQVFGCRSITQSHREKGYINEPRCNITTSSGLRYYIADNKKLSNSYIECIAKNWGIEQFCAEGTFFNVELVSCMIMTPVDYNLKVKKAYVYKRQVLDSKFDFKEIENNTLNSNKTNLLSIMTNDFLNDTFLTSDSTANIDFFKRSSDEILLNQSHKASVLKNSSMSKKNTNLDSFKQDFDGIFQNFTENSIPNGSVEFKRDLDRGTHFEVSDNIEFKIIKNNSTEYKENIESITSHLIFEVPNITQIENINIIELVNKRKTNFTVQVDDQFNKTIITCSAPSALNTKHILSTTPNSAFIIKKLKGNINFSSFEKNKLDLENYETIKSNITSINYWSELSFNHSQLNDSNKTKSTRFFLNDICNESSKKSECNCFPNYTGNWCQMNIKNITLIKIYKLISSNYDTYLTDIVERLWIEINPENLFIKNFDSFKPNQSDSWYQNFYNYTKQAARNFKNSSLILENALLELSNSLLNDSIEDKILFFRGNSTYNHVLINNQMIKKFNQTQFKIEILNEMNNIVNLAHKLFKFYNSFRGHFFKSTNNKTDILESIKKSTKKSWNMIISYGFLFFTYHVENRELNRDYFDFFSNLSDGKFSQIRSRIRKDKNVVNINYLKKF
jgi:hypothetical protein